MFKFSKVEQNEIQLLNHYIVSDLRSIFSLGCLKEIVIAKCNTTDYHNNIFYSVHIEEKCIYLKSRERNFYLERRGKETFELTDENYHLYFAFLNQFLEFRKALITTVKTHNLKKKEALEQMARIETNSGIIISLNDWDLEVSQEEMNGDNTIVISCGDESIKIKSFQKIKVKRTNTKKD